MPIRFSLRASRSLAALLAFLLSGASLAQEAALDARIATAKADAQQKAATFRSNFGQTLRDGELGAARHFELKMRAADNLVKMLSVDADWKGKLVQVGLAEEYATVFDVDDFSTLSPRTIRGRTPSANRLRLTVPAITKDRLVTRGNRTDVQALEALEDRALVFAEQRAYSDQQEGIERAMKALPKRMNDVFAAVNPATGLLEAATGKRVRGDDVGRDLTAGERVLAGIEGTVASGGVALLPGAVGAAKEKVGPGTAVRSVPRASGAKGSSGGKGSTGGKRPAGGSGSSGGGAGRSNRGGDGGAGGGRGGSAAGAGAEGPNGPGRNRVFDPTKGLDGGGKGARPRRQPRSVDGEERIGKADLTDTDPLDIEVATQGLDNFNVDLKTGVITKQPKGGGRISKQDEGRLQATFEKAWAERDAKLNAAYRAELRAKQAAEAGKRPSSADRSGAPKQAKEKGPDILERASGKKRGSSRIEREKKNGKRGSSAIERESKRPGGKRKSDKGRQRD